MPSNVVWVVADNDNAGWYIRGIYSTKRQAVEFMRALPRNYRSDLYRVVLNVNDNLNNAQRIKVEYPATFLLDNVKKFYPQNSYAGEMRTIYRSMNEHKSHIVAALNDTTLFDIVAQIRKQ